MCERDVVMMEQIVLQWSSVSSPTVCVLSAVLTLKSNTCFVAAAGCLRWPLTMHVFLEILWCNWRMKTESDA